MQIQPLVAGLQCTLQSQAELGGGDPAVEAAVGHLVELLVPALRQATLELAEQAACEVRAQLPDRIVDVVLLDGDATLRIGEPATEAAMPTDEDLDARITLRLPPSLKRTIEDVATSAGDSVNTWVVEQLAARARGAGRKRGFRSTGTFDL